MTSTCEKKYTSVKELSEELGVTRYAVRQFIGRNRRKILVTALGGTENSKWIIERGGFMRAWNREMKNGVRTEARRSEYEKV